jgi:hypothetical protein
VGSEMNRSCRSSSLYEENSCGRARDNGLKEVEKEIAVKKDVDVFAKQHKIV